MGAKLDLYRDHKEEYAAKRIATLVKVAAAKYLTIEGEGKPGSKKFQDCVGALYAMAYTIKMARKFAGQDYKVCQLEGLWWSTSGSDVFAVGIDELGWKLIIRVPDFVDTKDLAEAARTLEKRAKKVPFRQVKLETIKEGECVQQLHIGPYKTEPATLEQMRAFARAKAKDFGGLHHEIYLSDPRRVAPEKLKTILRYPVKKMAKAAGASQ